MPSNYTVADKNEQNPMLGLIGFIVIVVTGGISFIISGPLTRYLTTAHVNVGMANLPLLPLKFPEDWSPLGGQMAVAFAIFMIIFAIAMIILFMFMRPSSQSETSVNLDVLRKEVQERKKVH